MTDHETRTRATYVANLFELATLLNNNRSIPLPWSLNSDGLTWYAHDIEDVLAIRGLMDDPLTLPHTSHIFPVQITGTLAGFPVSVNVAREIALAGAPARVEFPMNPRLLAAESVNS